ncbi:hypothetical protein BDV98DRAFT_558938 [Pterulicium gracile]|uniref:Uncharacterized protein n=1 Tax=Pterulicium gracile TaxID=1884261 RepID=A0A5C3QZB6_9AGAR|nr:hypothetical protein BDV98DRAFT_558938 [Pterula gracilis]
MSLEEAKDKVGEADAEAARVALASHPNRVWKFLNPNSAESKEKQMDKLLLKKATSLVPQYTLGRMKEIAYRVERYEGMIQSKLGHFGLND